MRRHRKLWIHGALASILALVAGAALMAPPAEAQEQAPAAESSPPEEPSTPEGEAIRDAVDEAVEEAAAAVEGSLETEDRVVRGGEVAIMTSIHVPANEIRRGEIVCIGCDVVIEGEVTGNIAVVGGTLDLSGKAGHDVVTVLSNVRIAEDVEIDHDFINVLSSLDDRGAIVGHERFNLELFGGLPTFGSAFGALGAILLYGRILGIILTFVIIVIMAAFVPDRIRLMSEEFPVSYALALLAGLGAYIALIVIELLLWISVIGAPVAILLRLVFLVLKVLGMAAIFHFFGQRVGRSISREMSLLGAIFIGYLIFSFVLVVPHFFGFVGLLTAIALRGLYWLLFECPAIGLILLTRAGGRRRGEPGASSPAVPGPPPASPPPAAPAPPVPPAPPGTGSPSG